MLLCLGEPPKRFLLYLDFILILFSFHFWSSFHPSDATFAWEKEVFFFIFISFLIFICWWSSFVVALHFIYFPTSSPTLPWTIPRFLHPFYTFSPTHHRVIRDTFIFNFSNIFFSDILRSLAIWCFFPLCSFTNIFDSTYVYQGFPGSRQFFLEVCRASLLTFETQSRPFCLHKSQ